MSFLKLIIEVNEFKMSVFSLTCHSFVDIFILVRSAFSYSCLFASLVSIALGSRYLSEHSRVSLKTFFENDRVGDDLLDQILPQECFTRLEVVRKPILPDVGSECRDPIVEASKNVEVNLI